MILSKEDDDKLLAIRARIHNAEADRIGMCRNNDFVNHANGTWFRRWFKDFKVMLSKEELAFITQIIMELE